MTITVAELRIGHLKKELADAEAAQQVKKTLASELAEADKAVSEVQRLVTINRSRLAEEIAGLEALSKGAALIPQGMSKLRGDHDLKAQRVNQSVHELTVEADKLEAELRTKQRALGQVEKKIAEHPTYKAARQKQRELVTQATELAPNLLKVPLNDLDSVLKQISILSEAENRLISNARYALRDAGLPDIRPLLAMFIQQVSPQVVLDTLPVLRAEAVKAITRVTEMASRGVVR
jgi:myosin heavy subunit